jgi:hypothetical protein
LMEKRRQINLLQKVVVKGVQDVNRRRRESLVVGGGKVDGFGSVGRRDCVQLLRRTKS